MSAWLPPVYPRLTFGNLVALCVGALIFLFPILAVTAPHGATNPFGLLFLLALFYGWRGWARLHGWEKRVLLGFAAYAGFVGLSMLIASHDLNDAFGSYGKHLRFVAFAPMYMMVRRLNLDLSRPLIAGVLIGVLVMCMQVVVQHYAMGVARASGSRDPVQFADVLMLCIALVAVAMITRFYRPWHYLAGLSAVTAGLFAGYVSLTRNAWLLVPVVFVLLLAHYRNRVTRIGWLVVAGSLVAICTLALHPDSLVYQEFESGLNDIQLFIQDPSQAVSTVPWGIRLNMWRNAWIIFLESPWFGTGLNDYEQAARAVVESGISYARDPMLYEQAHNAYIHTMAESGLFAMLAFVIGVLVMPLLAFLRHWGTSGENGLSFEVLGGVTVVLAFAIFGIGHTWMGSNNFVSVYLLFILVLLSSMARTVRPLLSAQSS